MMESGHSYFTKRHARSASDSACLSPDGSDSVCSIEEEKNCQEDATNKQNLPNRLPLISTMVNNI